MMCCISPSSFSVEQSLNTLRYGNRVKELRSPIKIDELKGESMRKNPLPHIDSEITVFSESNEESQSFGIDNDEIKNDHFKCIIESSKITDEERQTIAKKLNQKEYLEKAIDLIEQKISNWTQLQAKMKTLQGNL